MTTPDRRPLTKSQALARYLTAVVGLGITAYGAISSSPESQLAWMLLLTALVGAAVTAAWLARPLLTGMDTTR
uniref:hypothetical protein n=1 Tax=Paractinoplanes polyasparticus TaxID=2856853 RepID=UPI001C85C023|nr:hypothetical protein [Actinoplanes polyasparticus]